MNNLVAFPKPQVPAPKTSDADDRAAALNIHKSCIVEAPAGSGKTGLLVQRFLKLLADDAVTQPEEILAITFTRKATAEMQERILAELQSAQAGTAIDETNLYERETRELAAAALARSGRLGWNLLTQPQRLNIRSIESVNMDLANSRPLLADSAGPLAPADDAGPLYRTAARRTLLQLGGADRALHHALEDLLLHRDGSIADCESLIAGMLQTREQWGGLVPLGGGDPIDAPLDHTVRPRLEQTLAAIVCAALQRALHAVPANVLLHLTQFAQRHAALPGYNGAPSPIACCAGKHQPPSAVAEHLDHWRALIGLVLKPSDRQWRASLAISTFGFKPPKPELDDFKLFLTSIQTDALQSALAAVLALPEPCYTDEQWAIAKSLFLVLRHALVELKLLFAARGECDFSEFALTAREALGAGGDITDFAIAAGGKLRHLLVDEMQDTSTGQYELIRLLTQSWDGVSQTLFLVGDPKQSIYLFRQARVERFLRTMREAHLGDVPLTPLWLTANFRSQAKLVDGFNETFGGTGTTGWIFPPPDDASLHGSDAVDVPFVAATSRREKTDEAGIVWHVSVHDKDGDRSDGPTPFDRDAEEARAIRRLIEQRLRQPLPAGRTKPWTIAVLARARNHLDAIVQELKAHDGQAEIPFRGVELDPLNERREVLDALALTRALLHPADRTAWLAVLHAPWCGLGLADLLALSGADSQATVAELVATRREQLSATGRQLLDRAWPILATAVDTLGQTQLSVHVERTWRSLGGDLALAAEQQANVQRLLAVLREVESGSDRHSLLVDLTARIGDLYAETRAGNIQLDLMTMHKAKGLEWDLVLIPGLHRKPRGSESGLLNWLELDGITADDEASIVLAPIWGKGADSDKLNRWLKDIRARRDRAEEKRLFYVACTRAREELHLFAALTRKASGELALPGSGTLLKACWPAAEPHFAALSARPQEVSSRPEAAHFATGVERPAGGPADADDEFTLALAAAAEPQPSHPTQPPTIQRLPLSFAPAARFAAAAARRLDYAPASALAQRAAFDRPEGGFAVRAFGNVVHRYLQVLAARVAEGTPPAALLAEVASWTPRLLAGLRGEGLAPRLAATEATRALRALTLTLSDDTGRWILSPRTAAASEQTLSTTTAGLRVDRTFQAGDAPLSTGDGCIWIVDFKTTEPGSRSPDDFAAAERAKYSAQLEAYAALRRSLPGGELPIRLGLFYPLIPRLLHWPSERSGGHHNG
jgi:ATP-dependent exoDNAse (exonuclease V) beta subunit